MSGSMFNRFAPDGERRARDAEDDASGTVFAPRSVGSVAGVTEAEVLAGVDRVPALPLVVTRLLALVGNDLSSASDMEALISQDMVIAGKLLKLVNSPFYGLSNEIRSLPQAVAIIGFASLRSLVLAASTADILDVRIRAYGFLEHGLWLNAMATGCVAREIAQAIGHDNETADEYFVAGLLRDVGMLALGPIYQRLGIVLAERMGEDGDLLKTERRSIGFDHCWAGQRVAEKWQLPEVLAYVVGRHHRIPQHCQDHALRLLASVRLAERLVCKACVGLESDHPFRTSVDGVLLGASGLSVTAFRDLVGRMPEIVAQAQAEGLA